jgi:hypothetical protein
MEIAECNSQVGDQQLAFVLSHAHLDLNKLGIAFNHPVSLPYKPLIFAI